MDPQQFLMELDSELRSVIRTFLTTGSPASEVTATDDSGRVTVTLRPDQTLARVQVAANWEEEILAPQLADTILRVAVSAQSGIPGGEDIEDADPEAVDAARETLLQETADELLAPMSEQELQQQIDDLPALLERLDARLDEAIAKTSQALEDDFPRADSDEDVEGPLGDIVESENKMVRVQLFQGHLADVRIKESWLEGRSGIAVTECFEQIVEQIVKNTNEQS